MPDYDLIVRNAKIVTAERQSEGDIAVKDGSLQGAWPSRVRPGSSEITGAIEKAL